jgi:hypothetical protein
MSIHALCPNLCATKLFWRTPYTTIEACNEHSSHAFYTTHTHPKEKDFWLPQQRSHQPSSTPFFHSSFNLLLSYLAFPSCTYVKLSIIFIKVALFSIVYFISKNNKHTYITPKFHNRTMILQFFSTY